MTVVTDAPRARSTRLSFVLPTILALALMLLASARALLSAGDIELLEGTGQTSIASAVDAPAGHALRPLARALVKASVRTFGHGELAVRLPAIVSSLVLIDIVALAAAAESVPAAGLFAALLMMTLGEWRDFYNPAMLTLPAALIAVVLIAARRTANTRSVGWLLVTAVSALAATWLQASAMCAAAGALVATAFTTKQRKAAIVAVAVCVVVFGGYGVMSSGTAAHAIDAARTLAREPVTALKEPAYATAFLQTAYGRVFGLLTPVLLLLSALPFASEKSTQTAPPASTQLPALVLALLPIWAYAPAWVLGRSLAPGDLTMVSVGCAVLIGGWVATLAPSTTKRTAWALSLTALVVVLAAMRDPLVTLQRDLDARRSRFALISWGGALDPTLPIVVANHDVFLQVRHYAPAGLADRLAWVDAGDTGNAQEFAAAHREFYVFEGAETRSPLIGWLVAHSAELSQARSFTPKDLSIDPPAYLYHVRLN